MTTPRTRSAATLSSFSSLSVPPSPPPPPATLEGASNKRNDSTSATTTTTTTRRRRKNNNCTDPTLAREEKAPYITSRSSNSPPPQHSSTHSHPAPLATTTRRQVWVAMGIVLLLGCATSAAFLALGIQAAADETMEQFRHECLEKVHALTMAWKEYEIFGLWIHQSCSFARQQAAMLATTETDNQTITDSLAARLGFCSRQEFQQLYEHVSSVKNVDFQAIQYVPLIAHADREALEQESAAYYATNYPNNTNVHYYYQGITQLNQDPSGPKFVPRTEQSFYWPVHYVEPVPGNEAVIDLDVYSLVDTQRGRIDKIVATYQPALSDRLRLVQETDPHAYGIILQHPGVRTLDQKDVHPKPTALAQVVIRVPSLLQKVLLSTVEATQSIYIYDSTNTVVVDSSRLSETVAEPVFLGGAQVVLVPWDTDQGDYVHTNDYSDHHHENTNSHRKRKITSLPEVSITDIPRGKGIRYYKQDIQVSDRTWTMVVTSPDYNPRHVFVILGGLVILVACVLIAIHLHRVSKLHAIQSETARMQVLKERQLNEFIAHEIRNPLSAALSALSFVSSGAMDPETHQDEQKKKCLENDIQIMDASLHFISELLRNMLDVHRAESQQMKLDYKPTDVKRDVLEPVAAVLCMRGSQVSITIDCPEDLVVSSDRMRLKQMILNLAANATKFVASGYIRLRGDVVNGSVQLAVEDSGPGIPNEKRRCLFAKFQDSLDSLAQGTGIGLAVCKLLSDLLGADIALDETFDSGVAGCPGTRFVISLNQPPIDMESNKEGSGCTKETGVDRGESDLEEGTGSLDQEITLWSHDLPNKLSVLFTDDDMILRRMFIRALKRAAPDWDVSEASSGETALRLVDTKKFDLIFMDQYMASVEKQMLGTDTVRALRVKGVASTIVGLSANDMADSFLEAGANHFMFKPFPFEKEALAFELLKILDVNALKQE